MSSSAITAPIIAVMIAAMMPPLPMVTLLPRRMVQRRSCQGFSPPNWRMLLEGLLEGQGVEDEATSKQATKHQSEQSRYPSLFHGCTLHTVVARSSRPPVTVQGA